MIICETQFLIGLMIEWIMRVYFLCPYYTIYFYRILDKHFAIIKLVLYICDKSNI